MLPLSVVVVDCTRPCLLPTSSSSSLSVSLSLCVVLQFYVGKWQEMETMTGSVSLTMRAPEQMTEPFLWKVPPHPPWTQPQCAKPLWTPHPPIGRHQ